jgi:hypothetical protein
MPAEINGRERTDSEMEADGRRRLDEIRAAVRLQQSPSHPQYRSPPLLFPAYVTDVGRSDRPFIPCVDVENIFHELQLPSEGYKIVNCYSNNANNPTVQPPYYNYIHEEGRVIICAWNYGYWLIIGCGRLKKWAITTVTSRSLSIPVQLC